MGSEGILVIVSVDVVDGVGVREKARGVVPVAVRGSDFAWVLLVFGVSLIGKRMSCWLLHCYDGVNRCG